MIERNRLKQARMLKSDIQFARTEAINEARILWFQDRLEVQAHGAMV